MKTFKSLLIIASSFLVGDAALAQLDETCVVNILNRTIQVSENGGWSMPNVPSNQGLVRARATCLKDDGTTVSGQSDYFSVARNGITRVGEIEFKEIEPIPTEIYFSSEDTLLLTEEAKTYQLDLNAVYADSTRKKLTGNASGVNYFSTNTNVASVSDSGVVTAVGNGFALLTARKDGVIATLGIQVITSGDSDGDGLPDEFEIDNNMNPSDPADAFEDADKDGLSAVEEFQAGTDILNPDTDSDGISDGEEVKPGADGFVTSPLLADSDGDGINDSLEITLGSDPTDISSGNLADAIDFITVVPQDIFLTYNAIDGEASAQLSVQGTMLDGSVVDLTSGSAGTTYESSDLTVASFGLTDGEIFAGQSGTAQVFVRNRGRTFAVDITVEEFEPVALSSIALPGYANNVDVQGDYAYVASGAAGLQVIDVTDRSAPVIVGSADTGGTAIDVKTLNNLVYLADGSEGVSVFDISDPSSPLKIGSVDTSGVAQDLALKHDFLFVADGAGGVVVFNIVDPANMFEVASIEIPNAKTLDTEGDSLIVADGSTVSLYDVSEITSPLRISSVNVGSVKNLAVSDGYIYVAAYNSGWKSFRYDNSSLQEVGGDRQFVPRDVAVANGFTFWAEQLFPNVVTYVNHKNADTPFFQNTINLTPVGGDYAGTGIAVDSTHAYITEERYVVSQDYKASGDTKLFIAQYKSLSDNNGIPPTASLITPEDESVVVENSRITISVDAEDDVAVSKVEFYSGGEKLGEDSTFPYSLVYEVPAGVASMVIYAQAVDLAGNASETERAFVGVEPDSDLDGLGDYEEVDTWNTDPLDADSDDDGLNDGEEIARGINPNSEDTDGDGITDGDEVAAETDPNNPDITAPTIVSTDPVADATGAPENTPIQVVFSEELLPKSVKAASLELLEGGNVPIAGNLQLISNNTELLFTADNLLKDFTSYTVRVSGIRDTAGNPLAADYEFSFETGNTVDTERPDVILVNPNNNASQVPVNALITVVMSERIDPATVTSSSFYVRDQVTGQNIEGQFNVLGDNRTLTFTPNTAFLVGRQHRISLTTGIQDLFGNTLPTHYYYFTTDFDVDSSGPQIVDTTVQEGLQDVPLNSRFSVRFNEAISALSLADITLNQGGVDVPVDRSISSDLRLVTLQPRIPLEASTSYEFGIDLVEDLSGNVIPQGQSINFTTGIENDTTASSGITWSSIPYGASGVPLNAALVVRLPERIDPTGIVIGSSFRLYDATQGVNVSGNYALSEDGRTLTYIPDELLKPNRQYRWYIGYSPYFRDLAGNLVSQNSYIYFSTGSLTNDDAPAITATNFLDGASALALNSNVVLVFDTPLSDSCPISIGIELISGGIAVPTAVSLSSDRRTVTLNPDANLSETSDYLVNINELCDYAGNSISGQALSFSTSDSVDSAGPSLQSAVPSNNATDILVDSNLVLTFNEDIDLRSQIVVWRGSDSVAGTTEVVGNTLTFTPLVELTGNTQYRVDIRYRIPDAAGNTRWNGDVYFTTEPLEDVTAPTVVAVSPEADMVDVNPNTSIVLSFSEPMSPASLNNNNIALYANGSVIRPSVSRSADGQSVTLSAGLPSATVVNVVLTDDVQDLSGNALVAFTSAFTTGIGDVIENSRPSVTAQYPANGSNNWLGIDQVILYVNETLDSASVEEAFNIAEDGVLIDGTLEILGDGRTLRFTKDTPFTEGVRVDVYLSSLAQDLNGNPLNNHHQYFTMGSSSDGVGTRPRVNGYFPGNNMTDVAVNPVIHVRFDEEMDLATVNLERIKLWNVDNGNSEVALDVALSEENDKLLLLTPQELLAADTRYRLYLYNNSIFDTDGDRLYTNYSTYFYTGAAVEDDRQPTVIAMSPTEGAQDVGVNTAYAVRYDETVNPLLLDDDDTRYNVQFSENDQVVRYNRLLALAPESEVTESAPILADASNNSSVPASVTFTTANGPDFVRPSVTDVSVTNNQVVAINPVLQWQFSESIDPTSVTSAGVYLRDDVEGVAIPASVNLVDNGRRIEIVPEGALKYGRQYRIYAYYLRDLSGNTISNTYRYFDTGFGADTTPPSLVNSTVTDGQVDIPTNVRLRVRYNEPMNAVALSSITLTDSSGVEVPVNRSYADSRRVVSVIPRIVLEPNSDYTLTVTGIEDISGNGLIEPTVLNFTTATEVDLTGSGLSLWSIPYGASNVPTNALIQAELGERIDPTYITLNSSLRLYDATQGVNVPGSFELAANGTTLTHLPTEALLPNRQYRWYVGYSPYFYDLAGNLVSQNGYLYFTTGSESDNSAPVVEASSFSDGATGLPTNARIVLVMDDPLSDRCPVNGGIEVSSGGVPVDTTAQLGSDRRTISLTANGGFAADTVYEVVITDLCNYTGASQPASVLSFTTGAANDNAGPSMQSAVPSNGSVDVSVSTAVTLTFNEAIDERSRIALWNGNQEVYGSTEVSGNTLIFTPEDELLGSTQYRVDVRYRVPDLVGNTTWNGDVYFTTEASEDIAAPTLEAISPAADSVDVSPNSSVMLKFSEPMNANTITNNNIAFYADGTLIRPTIYRSADGKNVTASAGLPANTLVSVVITNSVTDLSGNAIAPIVSSFTTGPAVTVENTRPSITAQVPANGSNNWAGINQVIMYASETLDSAALEDAFHIAEDGALISGTLELLGDGRTLVFTKAEPFTEGVRVDVYLNTSVTDLNGNPLNNYASYFSMGTNDELAGRAPRINAYYPGNNQTGVAANPIIHVRFDEPMDSATINTSRIKLWNVDDGNSEVAVDISLDASGRLMLIEPQALLSADTRYRVYLYSNSIYDTDGDRLYTNYSTYFYTGDAVEDNRQPMVLAMSPTDGADDIGVNTAYSVRYDESTNPLLFDIDGNRYNAQFSEDNRVVRYNRFESLTPLSSHAESAPILADASGNASLPYEVSFTTGNGPDYSRPNFVETSFINNATTSINPVVSIMFDEALDPVSITESGVYLRDQSDNVVIPTTYELSSDGKRLTLVAEEALPANHNYRLYIYYLRDLSGNAINNTNRYFTTNGVEDLTAPEVVNSTLFDGQTNVPMNVRLNVQMDEPLNLFETSGISLVDINGDSIPLVISFNNGRRTLEVVPKVVLKPSSTYTLTVGGIEDISGNAIAEPYVLNFTTGIDADLVGEGLSWWSIPSSSSNVPTNASLQVLLNERIDPTSIQINTSLRLYNSSTGSNVPGDFGLDSDGRLLSFFPDAVLEPNSRYYWYVGYSPYLRDLAGNGVAVNQSRTFVTGAGQDAAAPVVVETGVSDGANDMPRNGRVVVVLDEPLSDACPIIESAQLSTAGVPVDTNVLLSSNRQILVVSQENGFDALTDYTLDIGGSCDYAGNVQADQTLLSFTTNDVVTDNVGPALTSSSPTANSVDVSVNPTIVLTFNESVDARLTDPAILPALWLGSTQISGSYEINGNVIRFTPDVQLEFSTQYRLDIRYRVRDYVGNYQYNGDVYFTTQAP